MDDRRHSVEVHPAANTGDLIADSDVLVCCLPDTPDTKGLLDNDIPATDGLMPKDGGTFEGTQPLYDGEGAFLHHAQAANSSGRVFILPVGTDNPSSPLNGDIVFFYTP